MIKQRKNKKNRKMSNWNRSNNKIQIKTVSRRQGKIYLLEKTNYSIRRMIERIELLNNEEIIVLYENIKTLIELVPFRSYVSIPLPIDFIINTYKIWSEIFTWEDIIEHQENGEEAYKLYESKVRKDKIARILNKKKK